MWVMVALFEVKRMIWNTFSSYSIFEIIVSLLDREDFGFATDLIHVFLCKHVVIKLVFLLHT